MNCTQALKIIILLCIGLISSYCNYAQIYVNQSAKGNNDGSSWENAFTNLQHAINIASENEQLWIAGGTYLPGKSGEPKSTSFLLTKGLQLYGGFAGTESKLSDRNLSNFPTILSGDLSQDDIVDDFETNRADNVWTVMLVKNLSLSTPLFDGFIFESGHADGEVNQGFEPRGGGLFTYGPLELRHCQFRQNYARLDGGALFFWDSLWIERSVPIHPETRMIIDSCQFSNNFGVRSGGAISHVLTKNEVHFSQISYSVFSNNKTEKDGGAIELYGKNSNARIEIKECSFEKNEAKNGGGIFYTERDSNIVVLIKACDFKDNIAQRSGGGVYAKSFKSTMNTSLIIDDCDFLKNATNSTLNELKGGGAVCLLPFGKNTKFSIRHSTFNKNSTLGWGGAASIVLGVGSLNNRINIDSCQFEANHSDCGGAILYQSMGSNDSLSIHQSQFKRNTVDDSFSGFITKGGAVHIDYVFQGERAFSKITDCLFENNVNRSGNGGALSITPAKPKAYSRINNSIFTGNEASENGGAFHYAGIDKAYQIEGCTFNNNIALEKGDHIHEAQSFDGSLYYIFFHGVLWVQILYSLLLFLISRERSTLFYTLLMIGISLFFLVIIDFLNIPYLNGIGLSERIMCVHLGLACFGVGLIKFSQHFLRINHYFPRAEKIVAYLLAFYLITQIVAYFLNTNSLEIFEWGWLLGWISNLIFCVGLLTPVIWAVLVARKGYQPAKYFLLATLFTGIAMALVLFYFVKDGHWLEAPIVTIQSLVLLTIIVLGLADGYRVNLLKKDKARAERLAELDAAKTRLYNNITHEFRTPLTVIMGSSEMIKGNDQEKQLIKRNSKQLLQLINQMLDLSKLEGGALKLELKQGDIIPFVEYLVESFQSLAASKHIQLTFYRELEDLVMDYDAEKMQMIISNLVSNAIKFTADSGKVVVHIKEEKIKQKPHFVLAVRDNGQGIPKKDLPHIFDRFFQVDDSDVRRSEGSGIGLALIKELVQLMNGSVEVTSKVGKGSVFTVRIPITKEAPLQMDSVDRKEVVAALVSTTEVDGSKIFLPAMDELPVALIVEDNRDVVSFLRSCLRKKYQIEVAYNGREGIDKALEIIPDIIISDVMMPEADGYTVCKTLKSDERTSHIPIILLTAKATQKDKVHGLDMGADAYLNKPFHREELEVRLQKLIELRKQLQSRYHGSFNGEYVIKNKEDAFIQKLRSIIEDKIEDENFSINELCHAVGLSRMQIHRKLKALTGMPTTSFIHSIRLQKGFELLTSTDLNVSEVAYKVGFSDHSYFTKLFVKKYGATPSDVSKRN